jgi:hypothetical protein
LWNLLRRKKWGGWECGYGGNDWHNAGHHWHGDGHRQNDWLLLAKNARSEAKATSSSAMDGHTKTISA